MDNNLPINFPSQRAISRHYGLDNTTIRDAIKAGKIAPEPDGSFDAAKIQAWRDTSKPRGTHYTATSTQPVGIDRSAIQQAELDYRQARAEKERLIADQLSGQLIQRAAIDAQFANRAEELARNLLVLSRRIAAQLAPACQQTLALVVDTIDRECALLLQSYARPLDGIKTPAEGHSRIRHSRRTSDGLSKS